MRNLAFILALAFVLAGCDQTEPTEALPWDAARCATRILAKAHPDYLTCIYLERSDVRVRERMAKDFGIKLIDCLRPNGGMVWATREECSEMMGISIDH